MLEMYKSHCVDALAIHGRAAFNGLRDVDHFHVWLRAMKAKERLALRS